MTCGVCAAPVLQASSECLFCRSRLPDGPQGSSADLLTYLAAKVPWARTRRGLFSRRPRAVRLQVGGTAFEAGLRRGQLCLSPELAPGAWVEALLQAVSREAAADHEVRAAVSRAGWALRLSAG